MVDKLGMREREREREFVSVCLSVCLSVYFEEILVELEKLVLQNTHGMVMPQ